MIIGMFACRIPRQQTFHRSAGHSLWLMCPLAFPAGMYTASEDEGTYASRSFRTSAKIKEHVDMFGLVAVYNMKGAPSVPAKHTPINSNLLRQMLTSIFVQQEC